MLNILLKILLKFLKDFKKMLINIWKNLAKIWIFSTIDSHCWLRRGLFPILCKFSWFQGGERFACSLPGDATEDDEDDDDDDDDEDNDALKRLICLIGEATCICFSFLIILVEQLQYPRSNIPNYSIDSSISPLAIHQIIN